ncbi:MAG: hypothetical protein ABI885_22710 [Gammaproteobacteria bacterium]
MSRDLHAEVAALRLRFLERAKQNMVEAEQAFNERETVMLATMASTLEWAARELAICLKP